MNDLARRLQLVHGLAALCAALMLATVVLSAFMRLSQAGIGCEPWPGCYAQAARDAAQGASAPLAAPGVTAARLAHRVVASMVLVLALTLLWSTLVTRPRLPREGVLAGAIVVLTLGLAALGIVTPGARLPAVVLGNLLGGFLTLALCARLARPAQRDGARLGGWAVGAALLVVLQVALGALISGRQASASCAGLAECLAQVQATPAAQGWPWAALNPFALPPLDAAAPTNPAGALAQALHRLGAVVLLPLLALLALLAWRRARHRAAVLLALLVAAQAVLGLLAGPGAPSIGAVLLHNALATLTLAVVARLA